MTIKHLSQNKKVSLNLEDVDLSKYFGLLIAGLKVNSIINELNLNSTNLSDNDLRKLKTCLSNDPHITTLKIAYNNFSYKMLKSLFETLTYDNTNISVIDVSGHKFDETCAAKFKDMLINNCVTTLTMRECFNQTTIDSVAFSKS